MTTTTGNSAATAPLTLMRAVSPATRAMVSTSSRVRSVPATVDESLSRPAVTPVASRPSLTTNRAAMNSTVGSPNPASDWSRVRTPVAHRASAAPMATMSTGSRFETNSDHDDNEDAKVIGGSCRINGVRPTDGQITTG